MRVAVEPFQVLPNPMSPIELGLQSTVHLWKLGVVPQPTDWRKLAVPHLAAAGVKTEAVPEELAAWFSRI
jgi:hypothetical protein